MKINGTAPRAEGPFRTAVVDPPWPYKQATSKHAKLSGFVSGGLQRRQGLDNMEYHTLTVNDLMALPVGEAVSGYLFLWTPGPFLGDGFKLLEAWGFKYATAIHWLKRTKNGKIRYGAGFWYRGSMETILVARKKTAPSVRTHQRNVFEWVHSERHSEKPEGLQDHIEEFFPGPYLELFARRVRRGWVCLGDECSADGGDIRRSLPALLKDPIGSPIGRRRVIRIPRYPGMPVATPDGA